MPISKGIDVQKSRFAALALETSSDSDDERRGEWETVKKSAHKPGGGKQAQKQVSGQEGENKPLSKNAKKRARKKRQQQAQVASEVSRVLFGRGYSSCTCMVFHIIAITHAFYNLVRVQYSVCCMCV